MSTPDFLPQNDSNYSSVRFYTAQDPYFYTVDNRPLQDLEDNLKETRSGGGDASRRAAALLALNLSAMYSELIATHGRLTAITGLQVIKTGNNSVRISSGSYYEFRSTSESVLNTMMKQALLSKSVDFNIASPVTGGTSIVYTIEGTFLELTPANAALSQIPYVDAYNKYLPSTYIHGELQLSIINGVAAGTGNEQPATTTSGKFPLYIITLTQGSSNYKVQLHPNAPRANLFARTVAPSALSINGAISSTLNDMKVFSFPKEDISGVTLPSVISEGTLSPYTPIKLKITFSPTMVNGSAVFRLRYKGYLMGENTAVINTTSPLDIFPITVVAGGIQTYITTVSIPTTEFAGFKDGKWLVNKEYLKIILERISNDPSDTNVGNIEILSITLIQ